MTLSPRRTLAFWAFALTLIALAPAYADSTVEHRTELVTGAGAKALTLLHQNVPVGKTFEIHVYAEGPKTGRKLAAVMQKDGVQFYDGAHKAEWWAGLLAANGAKGRIVPAVHTASGRALLDLVVEGGGATHLVAVAIFDPDNPWGPCPGPDDAPTCQGGPVIIIDFCKFDVDQCSGGPLPWPYRPDLTVVLDEFEGLDPDGDPAQCAFCAPDPDGDPALGAGIFIAHPRSAVQVATSVQSLGTSRLSLDKRGFFERVPPQ